MTYVAKIIIDHTKVAADLTDFPIYVDLANMPSSFWSVVANGGGDIRVYKSDDTTQLPREVVSCDTSGQTGEMHIKYTGTLSSTVDTEIHIYADGTSSEPSVSSTYGRNAVWSDYKGVWHLGEAVNNNAGGYLDSTGNGNDLTGNSMAITAPSVKVAKGQAFDGSADYLAKTSPTSALNGISGTAFTGSFWGCADVAANDKTGFGKRNLGGGHYGIRTTGASGSTYYWKPEITTGSNVEFQMNTALTQGVVHFIAFTYNGSTIQSYLDGATDGSDSQSGNMFTGSSSDDFTIATRPNDKGTLLLNGKMDEVRIAAVTRSANWLLTEYRNQNSASTFYTASAAATNVTVSASVLSATFSVPTRTVTGTANVTPSVLSAAFSTQAPAISGGATVSPSVLAATFSIPAPNIITPDALINASILSASFSVQSPTVGGGASVAVGVLTATFSQPTATFRGDYSHPASVLSATFSTPAPTISAIGNVSIAASVLSATFSLQSTTVSAEQNAMISAGVLSATFTVPTPTITAIRNVEITATTLVATFSIPKPLRKVGGLWTAQPREEGVWTPQARAI